MRHIAFIRRISTDHPEWGEDRIALELELKLGVVHSPSTIRRYMVNRGSRPGSTWRKFLASHADQMLALDLTTQHLWNYFVRFVLVILALHNRRVVHIADTDSPTLDWVKQQIREATPWDESPRFLIHDNDGIFGQYRNRERGQPRCALDAWLKEVMGVKGIPIPYGAPNAAAYIERFMGTLKRECMDHFIFFSEGHLLRTAICYRVYYNQARPDQGIRGIPSHGPGCGLSREGPPDESSKLIAEPVLGGLHHDYRLAA